LQKRVSFQIFSQFFPYFVPYSLTLAVNTEQGWAALVKEIRRVWQRSRAYLSRGKIVTDRSYADWTDWPGLEELR
jgi:hypothetical protein